MQTGLVCAEAHTREELPQLFLVEHDHLSGLTAAGERIQQNNHIPAGEIVNEVEGRRADIKQLNTVTKLILSLQSGNSLRTKTVILKQDIADSGNENMRHLRDSRHSTFTVAIALPEGS